MNEVTDSYLVGYVVRKTQSHFEPDLLLSDVCICGVDEEAVRSQISGIYTEETGKKLDIFTEKLQICI